jgi:UDP-glucose 4-epimerase
MKVLVTGALGFTGRAVVRQLLAVGHVPVAMTSRAGQRSVAGVELVTADLRDLPDTRRAVRGQGFDAVCHLAALTRVRDSLTDPVAYFQTNVTGTLNLLQCLAEDLSDGRPLRFVLASTGAVYGAREGRLSEREPPAPSNAYGASKWAAEQALGHQAAAVDLAAVSLRCFNIAGAVGGYPDPDQTRIIPKVLAVAAGQAECLQVNGDGSAVREYTHVIDVARAFGQALDAARPGEHRVLNVGTGHGVSVGEVIETARAVTGRAVRVQHRPPQPEARVLVADAALIRRELDWEPTRSSLTQILADGWDATVRQS